jgi:hypothetical protein
MARQREDNKINFEKHFIPEPNTGCWIWIGANQGDYGFFSYNAREEYLAHRGSYRIYKGNIPEGLFVLHKCNVKMCVNPDHLYTGTREDNQRDILKSGDNFYRNKTHCIRGHEYSGENLFISKKGGRACNTCRRLKQGHLSVRKRLSSQPVSLLRGHLLTP